MNDEKNWHIKLGSGQKNRKHACQRHPINMVLDIELSKDESIIMTLKSISSVAVELRAMQKRSGKA